MSVIILDLGLVNDPKSIKLISNKSLVSILITAILSDVTLNFRLTVRRKIIFGKLRYFVHKLILDKIVIGKDIIPGEVFLTKDKEGKVSAGKDCDKIGKNIQNDEILYVNYYLRNNIWTPRNYPNLKNESCRYCGLITEDTETIRIGWTKETICMGCKKKLPHIIEMEDGKLYRINGEFKTHCSYCGNSGVSLHNKYIPEDYIFGKCDKCLSPRERQCANCSIPVEFVELCKTCKKTYCSDKCREEDKHNEKCK